MAITCDVILFPLQAHNGAINLNWEQSRLRHDTQLLDCKSSGTSITEMINEASILASLLLQTSQAYARDLKRLSTIITPTRLSNVAN
jgi:hypothetical protein